MNNVGMQLNVEYVLEKFKEKLADMVSNNVLLETQVDMLLKENELLRERVSKYENSDLMKEDGAVAKA